MKQQCTLVVICVGTLYVFPTTKMRSFLSVHYIIYTVAMADWVDGWMDDNDEPQRQQLENVLYYTTSLYMDVTCTHFMIAKFNQSFYKFSHEIVINRVEKENDNGEQQCELSTWRINHLYKPLLTGLYTMCICHLWWVLGGKVHSILS